MMQEEGGIRDAQEDRGLGDGNERRAGVTADLVDKVSGVDLGGAGVAELGGKGGGGRPDMAQGGGKDASNADAAIAAAEAILLA